MLQLLQLNYELFLAFALYTHQSESDVSVKIYAAMCIKTHLNNALYQITAVCFEHEQNLHQLLASDNNCHLRGSSFL